MHTLWSIPAENDVHTRLPSLECDLHVTSMSPSCMWPCHCAGTQESGYFDKQNDDKHTHHAHTHHAHTHTTHTHTHTHTHTQHRHIHTQSQKLTLLYREGEHPMHYGHNRPQSSSPVDPKQLPALWLRSPLPRGNTSRQARPQQDRFELSITVKVCPIRACGKVNGAVRGLPSCSHIRQQCSQTLYSVLLFQMWLVLNSTSQSRECSEGLTVNGLQVITPPHNMYCTGTQGAGYFSQTE